MNRAFSLRSVAPLALAALVLGSLFAPGIRSDETTLSGTEKLDQVVQKVAGTKKLLRYKFEAGQEIRWKVVNLSTVELTDKNFKQTTQSKTTSVKLWKIDSVADDGSAVVVNMVEEIDLWNQANDAPAEKYNSRTDKNPPLAFQPYAESIGKPLSTKTYSTRGEVLNAAGPNQFNLGIGPALPPLPEEPVGVGHRWSSPDVITIRPQPQQVKTVKVQYVYTLESFDGDLAQIRIKTEILTPIDNPQEQSQLVQNLIDGSITLDLAKGQISERRVDWDSNVVGFNGQQGTGSMNYLARLTETLLDGPLRLAPETPPAEAKAPIVGPLPR